MPTNSSSNFIKEFAGHIFSSDSKILFFEFCEVKVFASKWFLVTQHIKTVKHERAVNQRKRRKQSDIQSLLTENIKRKVILTSILLILSFLLIFPSTRYII